MITRVLTLVLMMACLGCEDGWLEKIRGEPSSQEARTDATSITWYMTLHAGSTYPQGNTIVGLGSEAEAVNTIPIKSTIPTGLHINKPRSMLLLSDGRLLLANGNHPDSAIYVFGLPNWQGQRAFLDLLTHLDHEDPLLQHPYDMAEGPDGSIYVSCQDSAVVLRYAGLNVDRPGQPLGVHSEVGPGCFIPPHSDHAHGLKSPRGLTFGPDGLLYVADRDHASVTAWNPQDGSFVRTVASAKDGLKRPIQIVFSDDGRLFIGDHGAKTVWVSKPSKKGLDHFIHKKEHRVKQPSALVIEDDWLYVGDRDRKNIRRFNLKDATPEATIWLDELPDSPEFLLRNVSKSATKR